MTRSIIGEQGFGVCLRLKRSVRLMTRAANAKNSRTARSGSFAVESSRALDRQSSQLERDNFSSNRHPALSYCLSMIFSENRYPLFRIMH